MKKIQSQKKNQIRFLTLQILNIILFISTFYLFDLFYLIWGYPEFMFYDINSIKTFEMPIIRRLDRVVEPFIQILIVFYFIFHIYVFIKLNRMKINKGEYAIFQIINFSIILISFLIILGGIYKMITFKGLLG